MGAMPFHLEKGALGLRMDYLTRSPAVRAHVSHAYRRDKTRLKSPAASTSRALASSTSSRTGSPTSSRNSTL